MDNTRFLGGTMAGVAVGVAWLALVWLTGWGLGATSLVLAVLVGLVLRTAAEGQAGMASGAIAAVIVALVILVGRMVVTPIQQQEQVDTAAAAAVSDDAMIVAMAQVVVQEHLAEGRVIQWPPGVEVEHGVTVVPIERKEDVPAAIWTEAVNRWNAMSREGKTRQVQARAGFAADSKPPESTPRSLGRVGLAGLLWIVVAGIPAFVLGSRIAT